LEGQRGGGPGKVGEVQESRLGGWLTGQDKVEEEKRDGEWRRH
jgi:hypothetical protein